MTRSLTKIGIKADIDKWRTTGDLQALERVEKPFLKANFYEKRYKLFERIYEDKGDPSTQIISARNHIFNHIESADTIQQDENGAETVRNYERESLQKMEPDFFPYTENMMPMDMVNNILLEYYDVGVNKYCFSVEKYSRMLDVIQAQGEGLIMQAEKNLSAEKQEKPAEQK